jgi:APA family basic amino acid/polyamine antiporter
VFSELGAMMPEVGGQYVYISKAIHPIMGFLNGWGLFWVIATGAIAFVTVMSAEYAARLFGFSPTIIKPMAIGIIWILSIINYFGIRWGSLTQNIFMILKLVAICVLIVFGLISSQTITSLPEDITLKAVPFSIKYIGIALVPILFSYGGWQNCNYVAEEMKNPKKNLPLAIIIGTIGVILIYILINLSYLRVIGVHQLSQTQTPAADTMKVLLGSKGEKFISFAIILSTVGIANLLILASPRVYFPAVRDYKLFTRAGQLHLKYRTPSILIMLQAVWCTVLIIWGSYVKLLNYVVFMEWLFFSLTGLSLIIFRKTLPQKDRPFKIPGYPFTPLIFIIFSIFIVINTFLTQPVESGIGLIILLSGIPIYIFSSKKSGLALHGNEE